MTWLLDRLLCIVKVGTDVIYERPQYSTSSSYEAVSSLLAILLASLEPLTEAQLHAVHSALYCGAPALSATQVIHLALLTAVVLLTTGAGSVVPLGRAGGHQERRLSHVHPSHTQVSLCPINIYKISTYTISRDWLQRRLRPQDSETARRFVCDVRSGQYTLHHHHHHYNYHHNHYHHHRPRRAGTASGPSAATACQHGHTACEVNHVYSKYHYLHCI